MEGYDDQDEGESFDANAFFKSIGQGQGVPQESMDLGDQSGDQMDGGDQVAQDNMGMDGYGGAGTDINNDLQLSESDNDDDDDDDDGGDFVPVDDDQSQSNFDMGEFFKPNP